VVLGEYSHYPGLDNPHAFMRNGTPYFAHRDAVGNVIALTTEVQEVAREYAYDPWGAGTGGADNAAFNGADRARWKGALWAGPEVELYYLRNRWYEPLSGRFLSEDPIGLARGINPYVFVGSDPVNGRDPTGLCPSGYSLVVWIRTWYDPDSGAPVRSSVIEYTCEPNSGPLSGGGERGVEGRVVAPDECPPPPAGPLGASVDANIRRAQRHILVEGAWWFRNMVRNNREGRADSWDYKQLAAPNTPLREQYARFGNFNYGATGRAVGFAPLRLQREAGRAQIRAGLSRPEWGSPSTNWPYGDDPEDQANIEAGMQYYSNGCHNR
jgi:RHS repeat-associated protein